MCQLSDSLENYVRGQELYDEVQYDGKDERFIFKSQRGLE